VKEEGSPNAALILRFLNPIVHLMASAMRVERFAPYFGTELDELDGLKIDRP
jgi:hypothetical protein